MSPPSITAAAVTTKRSNEQQEQQVENGDFNDLLEPQYYDTQLRKSTLLPAIFNLVATMVGGGDLSLSYAFQKCGIVLGTILMIIAAIVTDLSLYLLCICARESGASTYGEVARRAFGKKAEWFLSGLLFVFLLFVLVAYMVLVRDIWTPLVGLLLSSSSSSSSINRVVEEEEPNGNIVLMGVLLIMAPFLVQYELHALRYNCYIGFSSMSILCVALLYRAAMMTSQEEETNSSVLLDDTTTTTIMTTTINDDDATTNTTNSTTLKSIEDVIFVSPIIVLSFLSHFNILPIQGALVEPSRVRMRCVIDRAVFAAFVLMYLLGLGGYLCFGPDTQGNILLNLSQDKSPLIFVGRIGCGVTIVLAMAMMALPCRRNVLELMDCWIEYRNTLHPNDNEEEEATTNTTTGEASQLLPRPINFRAQHSLEDRIHLAKNPVAHYGSTFVIIFSCYLGAVAAPGVAVVWSLCGSFMAYLIGFILPTACFLELQRKLFRPENWIWRIISWTLLILSIVAAVACTLETTYTIFFEGAP